MTPADKRSGKAQFNLLAGLRISSAYRGLRRIHRRNRIASAERFGSAPGLTTASQTFHIMNGMVLETERLILDTWCSADWSAFRPIASDAEVMRYITGGVAWDDEKIRAFVERQMETYRTRRFCRWKLLEKPTGKLIGFCGPGLWRDAVDPEIGWWLARPYWGRGLAIEAATSALRHVFERVGLERIISVAVPENRASIRVMEKLGLAFDAHFESNGVQFVRYAIDRKRYLSRHSEPKIAQI